MGNTFGDLSRKLDILLLTGVGGEKPDLNKMKQETTVESVVAIENSIHFTNRQIWEVSAILPNKRFYDDKGEELRKESVELHEKSAALLGSLRQDDGEMKEIKAVGHKSKSETVKAEVVTSEKTPKRGG